MSYIFIRITILHINNHIKNITSVNSFAHVVISKSCTVKLWIESRFCHTAKCSIFQLYKCTTRQIETLLASFYLFTAMSYIYQFADDEQNQDFDAPTGPASFRSASWRSGRTLITLSYATAAGKLIVLNVAYRLAAERKTEDI